MLPLIVCTVLFVGALVAYLLFGDTSPQANDPALEEGVLITEILSNNKTIPMLPAELWIKLKSAT